MKKIRIAYIGGGSKLWAHVFMNDLALAPDMGGTIALYDIDVAAARRNQAIGERLNRSPKTLSRWEYVVAPTLEDSLRGADFVILSILPGTFDEMASDVHAPEHYGIWQSVGDTTGPGGVLRAMRTVPLYEGFAKAIAKVCPDAWAINFTNPMTVCTRTLAAAGLKTFGCCHEVFGTQEFLACVAEETFSVPRPDRREIQTEVAGVNHFTWIPAATWKGHDLMAELPAFMDRHFAEGYCVNGTPSSWNDGWFNCGNRVKLDLYRRFGALGAAGDRHLAEFMPGSEYLADPATAETWRFTLTPVSWRKLAQDWLVHHGEQLAAETTPLDPERSEEEAVGLLRALLGMGDVVSNVNAANVGQMKDIPTDVVVETNCRFSAAGIEPLPAMPLPDGAARLVRQAAALQEGLYQAIRRRDLRAILDVFRAEPALDRLDPAAALDLFRTMVRNTAGCLAPFFDVSEAALAALGRELWTN